MEMDSDGQDFVDFIWGKVTDLLSTFFLGPIKSLKSAIHISHFSFNRWFWKLTTRLESFIWTAGSSWTNRTKIKMDSTEMDQIKMVQMKMDQMKMDSTEMDQIKMDQMQTDQMWPVQTKKSPLASSSISRET